MEKRCISVGSLFPLLGVVMLTAVGSATASVSAQATKPDSPSILAQCRADLAKRLKVSEQNIKLVDARTVAWPSTALGLPEIGKAYAQVKTPGQKLILEANNRTYLYTASKKAYKYGGPLRIWADSMLYLRRVPNDPNLNSDLYQCSLIGTNGVRLATEVDDYYPQENGGVIAHRRTSRSTYDLVYVEADHPGKDKTIYRAMAFGAATLNKDKEWAAFTRPRLGTDWTVVIGKLDQETSKPQVLPMPDGLQPQDIAWSGDTLMVTARKGEATVTFETSPKAESPAWKQINNYSFPGYNRFMLNKSETLEVTQITEGGKNDVEVALVWFTGDRNVVATISDLTLRGYDLVGSGVFVWGEKNSRPAAYTVDMGTGAYVVSFPGTGDNIKPFACPPRDSLIPKAPKME